MSDWDKLFGSKDTDGHTDESGFTSYQLYIGEATEKLRDVVYGKIDVSTPYRFQSLAKIMVCPKCGLHDVQLRDSVKSEFREGTPCPRPGCDGKQVFKLR